MIWLFHIPAVWCISFFVFGAGIHKMNNGVIIPIGHGVDHLKAQRFIRFTAIGLFFISMVIISLVCFESWRPLGFPL